VTSVLEEPAADLRVSTLEPFLMERSTRHLPPLAWAIPCGSASAARQRHEAIASPVSLTTATQQLHEDGENLVMTIGIINASMRQPQ
jgi:hypothetical protein